MEWLRKAGLKKSFFVLTFLCLLVSLALAALVWFICVKIQSQIPSDGLSYRLDGMIIQLEPLYTEPLTLYQKRVLFVVGILQILSCILFPVCGMAVAGILFYRLKCKVPIEILEESVKRIQNQDLDFHIPKVSEDELGQLCAAFETMRDELLQSNQELWRQAEERKRLNAAFSHDLRNPVTVLKGTVKMLRKQQGACDLQALERLENYTLRIEQYVEAMSSIQRLEQYPVKKKRIDGVALTADLIQTANLLAPQLSISVRDCGIDSVILDYGLFMIVAENLIGNAARFAQKEIDISLEKNGTVFKMQIIDDGAGFPLSLLQNGPKPFGKIEEDAAHFGMGLYSSQLLCIKHGGDLQLENQQGYGASVTAFFACSQ